MKKYAVAVLSLFDNENQVKIVEAADEIKAVVLAVGDDEEFAAQFASVIDVKAYYINGEIAVSDPVELG